MIRKHVSRIILLVILFNIGGYYIWFGVLNYNIHKEIEQTIRNGLKDEELILIEISGNHTSDIIWIEQNKEFRLNGEMYDVVRIIKKYDRISYYCINDSREEKLIANFKKAHNTKKETDKKNKTTFHLQYFPQKIVSTLFDSATEFRYPILTSMYNSNIIDIQSPPPKSV